MGQQEKNEHTSQQLGEIAACPKRKTGKATKQRNQLHEVQRMAQAVINQIERRLCPKEDRETLEKAQRG